MQGILRAKRGPPLKPDLRPKFCGRPQGDALKKATSTVHFKIRPPRLKAIMDYILDKCVYKKAHSLSLSLCKVGPLHITVSTLRTNKECFCKGGY